MSKSRSLDVRTLAHIAHDLRGAAGVTAGALDELDRSVGATRTEHQATLGRLARKGVARILRLADRYDALAEIEELPARTKTDMLPLVAHALRQAELAFGRRNVAIAEAVGGGVAMVYARGLEVAVCEAAGLAILIAKTRVTCSVASREDKISITLVADAPARELYERWASRAFDSPFDSPKPAANDEALRFLLLHRVAGLHGGDAVISVDETSTRIELHFLHGVEKP